MRSDVEREPGFFDRHLVEGDAEKITGKVQPRLAVRRNGAEHLFANQRMRSPNFFNAAEDKVKPKPGASFNFSQPLAIFGGSSKSSACSGSRSGSVKDSTMQPAGVAATMCAWMKQS